MVDTIVLLLGCDMYQIIDPDAFHPSARWVIAASGHDIQSKQNPTIKELKAGIYKPRLTLSARPNLAGRREIMLKIELSLPKHFFGNNFDELKLKDFNVLAATLSTALEKMGVASSADILAQAPVAAIHYSKNIPLTDGSTPYHYINKIKEANIKRSLDVNQTDYRNNGHSYKWHCNSYEVVFYDKIKDLQMAKKSEKRSLEKDNALQMNFILPVSGKKKFEILRMEVRLNKRQKIKQLLQSLNIKSDLTFKKLFKPAISKAVLCHYIDLLEAQRPPLLDYKASSDKGLLADLIFNNPAATPKKILQIYGLKKALDVVNIRELRSMFAHYDDRAWYRLMSEANEVNLQKKQYAFTSIKSRILLNKAYKQKTDY